MPAPKKPAKKTVKQKERKRMKMDSLCRLVELVSWEGWSLGFRRDQKLQRGFFRWLWALAILYDFVRFFLAFGSKGTKKLKDEERQAQKRKNFRCLNPVLKGVPKNIETTILGAWLEKSHISQKHPKKA